MGRYLSGAGQFLLLMAGLALLFAGCEQLTGGSGGVDSAGSDDDGSGDDGSGNGTTGATITLSVTGAADHNGDTVGFAITEPGGNPGVSSDIIASGQFTISGGGGSKTAMSGDSEHSFSEGQSYDLFGFIDADDSGTQGPENGDYSLGSSGDPGLSVSVDGDKTVEVSYPSDFFRRGEEISTDGSNPSLSTLDQRKVFRIGANQLGYVNVPTLNNSGKVYAIYMTEVTGASLSALHGYYDDNSSTFFSSGNDANRTAHPSSNDLSYGFAATASQDYLMELGSGADGFSFEFLVREAAAADPDRSGNTESITSGAPKRFGATRSSGDGGHVDFTPSSSQVSTATISLTNLTRGADIIVHDDQGTIVKETTGANKADFSNSLSFSGLTQQQYDIEILPAGSSGAVSVGVLEVTVN